MKLPESVPQKVIELDKPRTIAFTFGALRRFKKAMAAAGKKDDDETPAPASDVMGTYIWAMLSDDDRKELTEENVWDLLHPGNIDTISAAFNDLVGEGTEGKAEAAPAP